VKLVVGFTVLFALVFAGVSYWLYSVVTGEALAAIEASLTNTINGAVAGVNGDEFAALVREGQPNSAGLSDDPHYANMMAWLISVHSLDPHASPYTYVPGPDGTGQPSSQATANPLFIVDAYAPIKDSSGAVVGALGVDYRADYVTQIEQNILARFIPPILVTYLVLVVLVFLVSRVLTRPLRRLARATERIGEGNYTERLTDRNPLGFDDEISTLTRVFQVMVTRVREREQVLAQKLERLTIQIDEATRRQEVDEIVESDFFQSLQGRADEMRQRRLNRSGADRAANTGQD
jgi:methyl-accepting chemotaxis protein